MDNIGLVILGGVLFNVVNILLVVVIVIVGMFVVFFVGIGFVLVIGVIVNYIDVFVGDVMILFVGVGLIVVVILLNVGVYCKMFSSMGNVFIKGLVLLVVVGCLMGLFYKYVVNVMFFDFI